MKKNVLKLVGIVAVVAIIGFSMAGCSNNGGGDCDSLGMCRFAHQDDRLGFANTCFSSSCNVRQLSSDYNASGMSITAWANAQGFTLGTVIDCDC